MGSMKINGTITLAAACLIAGAGATRSETRYFWSDADGGHYRREKPRMVTPYQQVSIPDTVAWRSPPAHTDGSTEGAALPAQDLFKKVAPSGSSGGGLFDAHGNLVAITSWALMRCARRRSAWIVPDGIKRSR
jgi:hypothetical protein